VAALAVHRRLPWVLAALSVLLVLPSLGAGYLLEDQLHQNILAGNVEAQGPASPYGLFAFVDGGPAGVRAMIETGTLPWWTLETLRIDFWRPLAELTHGLDHALAPGRPGVAHAQSLLWGAALVWLATGLFREIHGAVLSAGFAAMVFALDDSHAFPLIWLANRNTLLAGALAIAALWAHVRGHRRARKPGTRLGPVLFALALLSAEAAFATLAYLVAYHVVYGRTGEPADPRILARFRPLLPYLGIASAYALGYRLLGYGVHGSGQYLDPLSQPGSYLVEALPRAVLLLGGQLATLPLALETFHYRDDFGSGVLLALAALIVWVVARALVAPRWARPEVRFWVLGMLLSLPLAMILGAFTRALMFVGIGGAGLLGVVFQDWYQSIDLRPGGLSSLARRGLVAMHLVLAPLALLGLSVLLPQTMDLGQSALDRLPGAEQKTWVFVNPRAAFWTHGNVQEARRLRGLPVPKVRALASGAFGVELTRDSEHCVDVAPVQGYLFLTADQLFRDPSAAMHVGWRTELSDMSAEVVAATPRGRPMAARFCFDRSLEDPSLHWIAWRDAGPEVFHPPAVGETATFGPVF
jgi:hypothetical protein